MPPSSILVAEDDPADVFLLRHVFRDCHIANSLEIVSDGRAAISWLQAHCAGSDQHPLPAMVLLDWFMTPVGGEPVLDWLKTQPKPLFPVIVLTGMQSIYEMKVAYEKGCHSFLVKPLDLSDVRQFMEKFKGIEIEAQTSLTMAEK